MLVIAVTCSNIGGKCVFEAPRRLSGEGVRALAHEELGCSVRAEAEGLVVMGWGLWFSTSRASEGAEMSRLSGSGFADAVARRRRISLPAAAEPEDGVRFAFYVRMSTKEFQDQGTSLAWQQEVAEETIADRGLIVVEYFDEGCSRRWSWSKRTQAAALLDAARSPDRGFDAVVVGEYERAFCGNQVKAVMAFLVEQGVGLWLSEAGRPVDLGDPEHRALMVLLGSQSRREVVRSRHRVLAAMRTQACEQGRFLGGRLPYGYRLVDAGPHPVEAHARWGRRLHQLEPDPVTGPWVRWILQQRAAGRSIAGIARELNDRGVLDRLNPSCVPRVRNLALVDEATFRSVQGIRATGKSRTADPNVSALGVGGVWGV